MQVIRVSNHYYNLEIIKNNFLISLRHTYDVIVDCTDNVASRYLINDVAVLTGAPLVSGSALRFEGQVRHRLLLLTSRRVSQISGLQLYLQSVLAWGIILL